MNFDEESSINSKNSNISYKFSVSKINKARLYFCLICFCIAFSIASIIGLCIFAYNYKSHHGSHANIHNDYKYT